MSATGDSGGAEQRRRFLPEIEGLRAVAVLSVLFFHIWPQWLPGGFVGVDVFFVISGFLITGILLRDVERNGRVSLAEFYTRRIRRLMPAATLVLVFVIFALPLLPQARWPETVQGVIASTLYVQNWFLASQSVDYLASEQAPSILKHFWSLSVEEQYYIFWPLILLCLTWIPGIGRFPAAVSFRLLILAVVLGSFVYSLYLTHQEPGLAYFSTLTRAWELGIGSLLAVTVWWRHLPGAARDALGLLGLALVAAGLVLINKSTPFPGSAALLPVVGTALVIAAGDSKSRFSAYALLKFRPLQYLGAISYSLYLWHWPVRVLHDSLFRSEPGWLAGLGIIAVSVVLAHCSKVWVEDRFRHTHESGSATRRPLTIGAIAAMVTVGVALGGGNAAPHAASLLYERVGNGGGQSAMTNPGARVLSEGEVALEGAALVPSASFARDDFPAPYREKCISRSDKTKLGVCQYGDDTATFRVALVGDSQAAQWQPALAEVANANGWALDVITKTNCALGPTPAAAADEDRLRACQTWGRSLERRLLKDRPDLVLLAQSPTNYVAGDAKGKERAKGLQEGLEGFIGRIAGEEIRIGLLRTVPYLPRDCAGAEEGLCRREHGRALTASDPVSAAAESHAFPVPLLDMTDAFCGEGGCANIVGNVVVYRAARQMTATYSRTLGAALARKLGEVFGIEDITLPAAPGGMGSMKLAEAAAAARRDNPSVYKEGCHVDQASDEPLYCTFGKQDAQRKIVIAGDSHSVHWIPAVAAVAERNGWKLYSFTKSACAFTGATTRLSSLPYESCKRWNEKVLEEIIELKPDVLVMGMSWGQRVFGVEDSDESRRQLASSLSERWEVLQAAGIGVLAIPDTPWMREDIPDCLSAPGISVADCNTPREEASQRPDAITLAAAETPGVETLDFTDEICDNETCFSMIDGQVIWRDRHHLTASFSRALAPRFEPVLKKMMDDN